MQLALFHNLPALGQSIPFILAASLRDEVIPPHNTFHIPVYLEQPAGRPPLFNVEICGFRLEAEAPEALIGPSARLLSGLINMARLPTYLFVAGLSRLLYPVYTIGDEVFATTPGGPVFRHVELAKVRRWLSDYLHTMAELGQVGETETLHVRGVDMNTLGLARPAFYLKKRVQGEEEFWAPVFVAEDGLSLYTYAASAKRQTPIQDGREVLALHAQVAEALMAQGRLHDPCDLRPDRLFPADLQRFCHHLTLQPYHLLCDHRDRPQQIPLYRNGKHYVAVEHRQTEDRYNLFIGVHPADLRDRVAQDLRRRQLLPADADLTLISHHAFPSSPIPSHPTQEIVLQ
ncbi:MAG: hypothetical protein HUU23_10370 [Caldilineales bacterium]|nr:hypothetical protein [Caldilineales bacterium]